MTGRCFQGAERSKIRDGGVAKPSGDFNRFRRFAAQTLSMDLECLAQTAELPLFY